MKYKWGTQKGFYDFKLYWIHTYFSFCVTGCVSISAFASLVGIAIGITISALGLKIFVQKQQEFKKVSQ